MWDFSGDEIFFLGLAGVFGIVFAFRYYLPLLRISSLGARKVLRLILGIFPVGCLLLIYWVLQNYSDAEQVRGHADYITLFMVGGALWIWGAMACLPWVGISVRDDCIERNNPAATVAACAVMLSATICYAGANIGTGPTIWTTIVPAMLATAALAIFMLLIQIFTGVSETITIDRHFGSSAALAAFLVLCGIDLGWAAAGDWIDWESTWNDFVHRAWPVLALLPLAIVVLILLRPRARV